MDSRSRVDLRFLWWSAALLTAFPASAQTVCNSPALSACDAQAQSGYAVCTHDNPKGSPLCSEGLSKQDAACQAQYGVCANGATCQSGVCVNPSACVSGTIGFTRIRKGSMLSSPCPPALLV